MTYLKKLDKLSTKMNAWCAKVEKYEGPLKDKDIKELQKLLKKHGE